MRDGVFSKIFFCTRLLILLGFCCFFSLLTKEAYAADGTSEYYSLRSRLEAIEECSDGVVPFGYPEAELNESNRYTLTFEEDFVLKCDIEVYHNFDLDLSGHTMSSIDGHKIYTKRGTLRIYNGTFDDVNIETEGGSDLVFGSGIYNNLVVKAGVTYDKALELNDKNEVYLQGGHYYNSTFYVSQNAALDVDGSSFVSDSSSIESASIVLKLDERSDSGSNIDAMLDVEAAYFKITNANCDDASIKIWAPDMPNNNSHIEATIEYAIFEGQNAISTSMGPNRTGDRLTILDGESYLDGNFLIAYENNTDPLLEITDGEYMTKAGFYSSANTCSNAVELRSKPVTAGIFSNPQDVVLGDGLTLLPLKNRDFDGDGNNDVTVATGIGTAEENITLNAGDSLTLDIVNLDGEAIVVDAIEWLGNNEYAEGEGLTIRAKKAGEVELTLKYGTQEKKYKVKIVGDEGGTAEEQGESEQESAKVDTPLTEDRINDSRVMFVAAGLVSAVVVFTVWHYSSRKRIEK